LVKPRRQRDGLEPPATDKALAVGKLVRCWLDTYVQGSPSEP
jgi:hypothetical protein